MVEGGGPKSASHWPDRWSGESTALAVPFARFRRTGSRSCRGGRVVEGSQPEACWWPSMGPRQIAFPCSATRTCMRRNKAPGLVSQHDLAQGPEDARDDDDGSAPRPAPLGNDDDIAPTGPLYKCCHLFQFDVTALLHVNHQQTVGWRPSEYAFGPLVLSPVAWFGSARFG